MRIKTGDKIRAAIGIEVREWEVKRIFTDGSSTWFSLETALGAEQTVGSSTLLDAINRATQTELTEAEI